MLFFFHYTTIIFFFSRLVSQRHAGMNTDLASIKAEQVKMMSVALDKPSTSTAVTEMKTGEPEAMETNTERSHDMSHDTTKHVT